MIPSNPCVRCGKERKLVKTWKELIGTSYTVYTETACPDAECQKIVDGENDAKEKKREENRRKVAARVQARFGHKNRVKVVRA